MSSNKAVKFILLIFFLVAWSVFSLSVGAAKVSIPDIFAVLQGPKVDNLQSLIIMELRLPRILLAIFVGAGIAASGAAIQGLFRNPLADPALIGF